MVDGDKLFDEDEEIATEIPEDEEDGPDTSDEEDDLDPKHLGKLGFGIEEDELM